MGKLALLACMLLAPVVLASANAQCSTAFSIPPAGGTFTDNTVGNPNSFLSCSFLSVGNDAFYTWQPPEGYIFLDTCGSDYDTILDILWNPNNCISPFYCAGLNDDSCGLQSVLPYSVSGISNDFLINIRGRGVGGTYILNALSVPVNNGPPANQFCSGAAPIPIGGYYVDGTTFGAAVYTLPSCAGTVGNTRAVHYTITPAAGPVTLDLCATQILWDTAISVYQGNCASLLCVANNDDGCSLLSRVSFNADGVTTYTVRIEAFSPAYAGDFRLTYFTTPVNNDCSQATLITVGSYNGFTHGGTADVLSSNACGLTVGTSSDVWYTFTPPAGNYYQATTCNYADFDTQLVVYTGGCGTQNCIASNNDDLSAGQCSTLSWQSTGATYLIAVTGAGAAAGQFQLDVTQCSTACSATQYQLDYNTPTIISDSTLNAQATCACTVLGSEYLYYAALDVPSNFPLFGVTLTVSHSYANGVVAVYPGTCSEVCDPRFDWRVFNGSGSFPLPVRPGETYTIVVSSTSATVGGNFQLQIAANFCAVPNF